MAWPPGASARCRGLGGTAGAARHPCPHRTSSTWTPENPGGGRRPIRHGRSAPAARKARIRHIPFRPESSASTGMFPLAADLQPVRTTRPARIEPRGPDRRGPRLLPLSGVAGAGEQRSARPWAASPVLFKGRPRLAETIALRVRVDGQRHARASVPQVPLGHVDRRPGLH